MAKTAAKTAAKEPKKISSPSRTKTSDGSSSGSGIEKACHDALQKLKELNLEQQLQHDIEWCLGSYRADGNPVGLYNMIEKAILVLKEEKSKKTKGVTAKLITDLEKVIKK
jgi:hypothetical protein